MHSGSPSEEGAQIQGEGEGCCGSTSMISVSAARAALEVGSDPGVSLGWARQISQFQSAYLHQHVIPGTQMSKGKQGECCY